MARPVNEFFDNITGTLGRGSATIDGITFYTDDPTAVISVTSDHRLTYTFASSGPHVFGYKSADGSNFNPYDSSNPTLYSIAIYSSGTYGVTEYRDGAMVAGSTLTNSSPSRYDFSGIGAQSHNIDQLQFSFTGTSAVIDDLIFSAPIPAPNAAPTIANLGGSITYVERGAPVALDAGLDALVSDTDSADFAGGALTVALAASLSQDNFGIATAPGGVTLSSGMAAGSAVSVQGTSIGTIRSGATGLAGQSLAIDLNANANAGNVSTFLHTLTYSDSATPDPTAGTRTATVTLSDGDGGSTTAEVGIAVVAVNDPPTLQATATNPTFTERGTPVVLFSNVTASSLEAGQSINRLVLTVSNVQEGPVEYLTIDGDAFPLVNYGTTTANGGRVVSSLSNGVATVTLTKSGGFLPADIAQYVAGITYEDRSENPTTTNSRVVTLTSIRDTGGIGSGGVDTTALSISSVVSLRAVNDAPMITSLGGGATAELNVVEKSTSVTTVTSTDVDGPGPLAYAISGADQNLFTIGSDGRLSFKMAPDYEHPGSAAGTNNYAVTVQVSDGAGGIDTQALTVHVTDANDTTPVITSGGTASEAENTAAAHVVYQTAVTDPDTVETTTYSLSGADAALFAISAAGAVTFKAAPDFEAPADQNHDNIYNLIVTASDGTNPAATQAVAVTVTDVNDVAPVITSGASASEAENTAADHVVYQTTVTDPDTNSHFTYSLGGADAALFAISDTGAVTFKASPDFEAPADHGANNVYDLIVNVSDGANPAAAQAVAVTVTDQAGSDSLTLRVSEDAFQGDAQFTVTVDGQQVGGVQTATASHAAGQFQDITIDGSFGPSPHSVAVQFINDAWGGSQDLDRNLYVDKLTIGGHVFEGENAVNTAGFTQGGNAELIVSGGALTFDTSANSLTLRVSEDAYQGDAQFIVTVDGHQVGGVQTVTASHAAGQFQDITIQGAFGLSPNSVAVQFINDAWGGSQDLDRNLYVDKLTLNGHVFEAENAANTAGFTQGGNAELIGSGGALTFDTSPTSLTFRVSEDAFQGDAQFIVKVDGQQVGGVQTVTASHAAGEFQDFTFHGNFGQAPNSVAVQFVNDAWGGSPDLDRNLYVDRLTLNGHVFEAENATNTAGFSVAGHAELIGSSGALVFDHLMV